MKQIYLISEEHLKKMTILDDNVDNNMIYPAISTAQDIRLVEIIGRKNVDNLKKFVEDPTIEGNDIYREAMNGYVLPFLSAQVMAEIQIPLSFKLKNQGMIQNTNDNYQVQNLNDIMYVKEYYEGIANIYANRVVEYYNNSNNNYLIKSEVIEDNAFPCSIYFPKDDL